MDAEHWDGVHSVVGDENSSTAVAPAAPLQSAARVASAARLGVAKAASSAALALQLVSLKWVWAPLLAFSVTVAILAVLAPPIVVNPSSADQDGESRLKRLRWRRILVIAAVAAICVLTFGSWGLGKSQLPSFKYLARFVG